MSKMSFSVLYVAKLSINNAFSLFKTSIDMAKPVQTDLGAVVTAGLNQFIDDNDKFGKQINKNQKSGLTEALNLLDKDRDAVYAEIKRIITSFLKSSNEQKKAASKLLKLFLDPNWDANLLPLNTESDVLTDLLLKLNARPDLLTAAQTLDIDTLFLALETKNNAFSALWLGRNTEYSEREISSSSLKPAAVAGYIQFCTALEQAVNLTPNDTIIAQFNKQDELRKKYHLLDSGKPIPPVDTTTK